MSEAAQRFWLEYMAAWAKQGATLLSAPLFVRVKDTDSDKWVAEKLRRVLRQTYGYGKVSIRSHRQYRLHCGGGTYDISIVGESMTVHNTS